MQIKLKNIGMLKEAELSLNSLTLIAGENDNGKSTVGKVVFCIIKAINRYKEDLQESKEHKLNEKFNNLFFFIRNLLVHNPILKNTDDIYFLIEDESDIDEKLLNLDRLIALFKNNTQIDEKTIQKIEKTLEEIYTIRNEPENINKYIESALNKVFISEFDSSILLDGEEEGEITLLENKLELIKIKVTKENKIFLLSDIEPIQIKDATFIESPLILNNHDLLIKSQSGLNLNKRNIERLGIPYTTLHTKDLFDKLKKISFSLFFDDDFEENILKEIQQIIDGNIIYDSQKRDFIYSKGQKNISIKNTASGIKSFGILQLLLLNGVLNKNSILILDEPENHLHPIWQLKYAKLLVTFAKNGITTLIASHSPYMIEALKRYSDIEDLSEVTNFYLAEDSIILPKDRLSDIFRTLEEPFEIFRKMDGKILKDE
ncbi:AAA family ATPase [Aliarcobacter cryaerophilus]|uniref:AAA family ATPase n=1 Tax=Aliarcobacter cryaerophilus TaxID=28198 RepID=UPI0021B2EB3B|nr:AAA family ATPase [Aliarcobacter cryaerophilus]MCT7515046.1 AAA family ATPase [Aliarcobacter cryaerophilus]